MVEELEGIAKLTDLDDLENLVFDKKMLRRDGAILVKSRRGITGS